MGQDNLDLDWEEYIRRFEEDALREKAQRQEEKNREIAEAKKKLEEIRSWGIIKVHEVENLISDFDVNEANKLIARVYFYIENHKIISLLQEWGETDLRARVIYYSIMNAETVVNIEEILQMERTRKYFIQMGFPVEIEKNSIYWNRVSLSNFEAKRSKH